MHMRSEKSKWGLRETSSGEEASWWGRHEPVVDAWLDELEAAEDPWCQSARHAAFCLVSYLEMEAQVKKRSPSWDDMDVADFLFNDLSEGGTVGLVGPVDVFFDHLVEALRRFGDAGLVEPDKARAWLAEMRAARGEFLRRYANHEPLVITVSTRRSF